MPYRLGQRRFVDHRAAGGVNENGAPLEPRYCRPIDEIAVLRRGRDMHRNDIGIAQKLVERDRLRRRAISSRSYRTRLRPCRTQQHSGPPWRRCAPWPITPRLLPLSCLPQNRSRSQPPESTWAVAAGV